MKIKNLVAAAYAPMLKDGTLNTGKIKEYSQFLIRNKISGVFMNGSTGDFTSLSTEERKQLTLAWSQNKKDDLYLIDHVGHTNIREAKELARYASDKVDAISVLAPYYFRLNKKSSDIFIKAFFYFYSFYYLPVLFTLLYITRCNLAAAGLYYNLN